MHFDFSHFDNIISCKWLVVERNGSNVKPRDKDFYTGVYIQEHIQGTFDS